MADEPKPSTPPATPPAGDPPAASPAPAAGSKDAPASKPADGATPPADSSGVTLPQAEALSDGTTPTVLKPGTSHKSISKGKTGLDRIYRKADIMTTLFTFAGAVAAAVIILGAYAYFTKPKNTPAAAPKTTTLNKADLDKLGSFFGGNSAGNSSEVLTISSSSLFNNRVAIASDLKVVGGVSVSGTTALGDLTVDKVSTLGVTNVRGQLTVAGPTNLQGPVTLGNGLSVTGNVTASGNGSFGGSVAAGVINAGTLTVTGALNLSGHINVSGPVPTISTGTIDGTDTAGSFAITSEVATITFHSGYTKTPRVIVTPASSCTKTGQFFVQSTGGSGFVINNPALCTSFNYWVVQ